MKKKRINETKHSNFFIDVLLNYIWGKERNYNHKLYGLNNLQHNFLHKRCVHTICMKYFVVIILPPPINLNYTKVNSTNVFNSFKPPCVPFQLIVKGIAGEVQYV